MNRPISASSDMKMDSILVGDESYSTNRKEKLGEIFSQLNKFDYVRLTVGDIHGIPRGKIIPARNAAKFLRKGMGAFSGLANINPRSEELPRVKALESLQEKMRGGGNMVMVPALETFRPAPWAGPEKYKCAEVLCETRWTNGEVDFTCPRYIARKQLTRLRNAGFTLMTGIEMEFVLMDAKTAIPTFMGADFYSNLILSQNMEFLADVEKKLFEARVNIEDMHVEPASGQLEINYQPTWGISGGDWPFIIRAALKEVASKHGLMANFMSRYISAKGETSGHCGNGAHFNHSLWDLQSKHNLFYDDLQPNNSSELCMHWVAGLMAHNRALTALYCPTVNCYQRMKGPWGPGLASVGFDDRFSTFRIKTFGKTSSYIENRIPSGLANPYLVMAATIAAGLDGIQNKLELKNSKPEKLPTSLTEALNELRSDKVIGEALGEDFIQWFCQLKMEGEVEKLEAKGDSEADMLRRDVEMYATFC